MNDMANNRYGTTAPGISPWELGRRMALAGQPQVFSARTPEGREAFEKGYDEGALQRAQTPLRERFAAAAATPPPTRMPSPIAQAFVAGAARAARGDVGLVGASTCELNQAYVAGHRAAAAGEVLRDPRTTFGVLGRGFRVRPPDWETLREAARFAQRQR